MTLSTPLRLVEEEGWSGDCRCKTLRIVDANGDTVDGGPSYFDLDENCEDAVLEAFVQAANRQAAAEKLANKVTTVLRMCKDAIDPFVASSDKPHGGNLLAIVSDINEAIEALSAYRATEVPNA